jgi:predicted dehydrogenase
MPDFTTRRSILKAAGLGAAALGLQQTAGAKDEVIPGFEEAPTDPKAHKGWEPVSSKKVKVGIVGYGFCRFGAAFSFQDHPNVEIVAVSDLIPERCEQLAKACRCEKTYPSLEELVKDKEIEAVFVATDAPHHAEHCILAMNHGKHVATAVPAVFGSLEQADKLFETVKRTGLKYMMFETSCYHAETHAMREIYKAGGFGEMVYAEGEYYHYMATPLPGYKDWRVGLPPQWYPTHSNAFYCGVTDGSFTEVSCMAKPSIIEHLTPDGNPYKNPFGTEIALFRTSEGGAARMAVSWDTPGRGGEMGRVRGQKGTFYKKYEGLMKELPNIERPPLPPGVKQGGHGGSHGRLMSDFIESILADRKPLVDICMALNMTVGGVVAHQSALKDGELLKIPQYKM